LDNLLPDKKRLGFRCVQIADHCWDLAECGARLSGIFSRVSDPRPANGFFRPLLLHKLRDHSSCHLWLPNLPGRRPCRAIDRGFFKIPSSTSRFSDHFLECLRIARRCPFRRTPHPTAANPGLIACARSGFSGRNPECFQTERNNYEIDSHSHCRCPRGGRFVAGRGPEVRRMLQGQGLRHLLQGQVRRVQKL
jgi:hypothetical protein